MENVSGVGWKAKAILAKSYIITDEKKKTLQCFYFIVSDTKRDRRNRRTDIQTHTHTYKHTYIQTHR